MCTQWHPQVACSDALPCLDEGRYAAEVVIHDKYDARSIRCCHECA
jgi:hypothetical protein